MNKPACFSHSLKFFSVVSIMVMPLALFAYTGGFASAPLPMEQPVGYVAQDDITDFDLSKGTAVVYRADYDPRHWSGNLHAYSINSSAVIDTSQEIWTGGTSRPLVVLCGT